MGIEYIFKHIPIGIDSLVDTEIYTQSPVQYHNEIGRFHLTFTGGNCCNSYCQLLQIGDVFIHKDINKRC